MSGKSTPYINIYISSSTTAEDLGLLGELEKQLGMLKREAGIRFWDKRYIIAGRNRQQQIEAEIGQAHLILLLLSSDFVNDCYDEMQLIMERMMNTGDVHVIPILMRPTPNLNNTPIGQLQPLPTDQKPVKDRADREQALGDIAEHIGRIIEQRRLGLPKNPPSYTPQSINPPFNTPPPPSNVPYRVGTSGTTQSVKLRRNIGLTSAIIIAIMAIVIVAGALVIPRLLHSATTNNGSSPNTTDPAAASIITNVQAASAIDPTSKQPISPTTSFRKNTDIYITFQLNLNGVDVSQQHPGYAQAKYYREEHQRLSTSHVVTIDNNTISGNSFLPFKYYNPTTAATVEVYWCRQKNCSDAQLAQTVAFTVS